MDVLQDIRESLKAQLPENGRAYLFGSRARGDFHDGSDWDILILLNQPKITLADKDKIEDTLYDIAIQKDQLISPIFYTTKEWEWRKATPFYANVMRDRISIV